MDTLLLQQANRAPPPESYHSFRQYKAVSPDVLAVNVNEDPISKRRRHLISSCFVPVQSEVAGVSLPASTWQCGAFRVGCTMSNGGLMTWLLLIQVFFIDHIPQ
jgi:hypothetical protein